MGELVAVLVQVALVVQAVAAAVLQVREKMETLMELLPTNTLGENFRTKMKVC